VTRHVVASVADIKPGEKKLVTVKGREIGVFNVNGEFYALANRCPHEGGPMCEGVVTSLVKTGKVGEYALTRNNEFVRCPWHGWEFEIKTGQSYCDPEDYKVRAFKVAVEPGDALVKGPYVAEKFDVSVDGNYVVIDL
jgi:3-phenylpropionate/trans-cinnamate dioxygenase ferredoxin subunit